MSKIVSVLSAAVLTLTLCACSSGSSTSSITVAGSTTCLPIAEIAAEGFKEETGIDVLVSGLGSSAGIEAVSAGTADIASSSRGLNADEQDLGLTPIVIAHDGIAVIVNDDNPIDNLSTEQLRDIYAGKITNWKEVGGEDLKIQVINRDEASGTREAFRTIVMDGTPFDRRSAVLSGTGQVRDVVSRSRGAIGYISLGGAGCRAAGRCDCLYGRSRLKKCRVALSLTRPTRSFNSATLKTVLFAIHGSVS